MTQTIITSQGQTTIPIDIRHILGVGPGQTVVWQVKKTSRGLSRIEVSAPSLKSLKALRGIGAKTYQELGGGQKHLQSERASWD